MPKLASLQDLARVRETAKAAIARRENIGTVIRIGMGTCGIAAGARETFNAIEEELAKHNMQAYIGSVGCIGMCAREPMVEIQQGGGARVLYGGITSEMVPRLISEHLIKGEPVKEWVVCRMPVEEQSASRIG